MLKEFPEDYDFFPTTYILPCELNDFKSVVKPKEETHDLSKPSKKKDHKDKDGKISLVVKGNRGNSSLSTAETTEKQPENPFYIIKPESMS